MVYGYLLLKHLLANHEGLSWNPHNPHKSQAWHQASVTPALLQQNGRKKQETPQKLTGPISLE